MRTDPYIRPRGRHGIQYGGELIHMRHQRAAKLYSESIAEMEVSTPAARNYLGSRPVQERTVRKSGGALGGKGIMEAKQSGMVISLGVS